MGDKLGTIKYTEKRHHVNGERDDRRRACGWNVMVVATNSRAVDETLGCEGDGRTGAVQMPYVIEKSRRVVGIGRQLAITHTRELLREMACPFPSISSHTSPERIIRTSLW